MIEINAAQRLIAADHKGKVAEFRAKLKASGIKCKLKMDKSGQFGDGLRIETPVYDYTFSDEEQSKILKMAQESGFKNMVGRPIDVHDLTHFKFFVFRV